MMTETTLICFTRMFEYSDSYSFAIFKFTNEWFIIITCHQIFNRVIACWPQCNSVIVMAQASPMSDVKDNWPH